jgi:hypothetical protein
MNSKKYTLKPGRHQFAPGSHAVHSNDNLSDDEAAWYLERYPHIAALFTDNPEAIKTERSVKKAANSTACRVSAREAVGITGSLQNEYNEDLSTTN